MMLGRIDFRPLTLAVFAIVTVTSIGAQPLAKSGPVPHDAARERAMLEQVKVADGFKATLFAAPPVAMYPVCLTGTVEGAVFVCVDPNLSLTATKGKGRVMRLVDVDHDGVADRYSVFAEMDSPRGVAFDGRTLYVMHPPNLTAYRDTTGDGIADVSEVLVTGLGFGLDFRGADHTTNGITMGIDGWLYIAVGDYGYRNAVGKDGTAIAHRGGGVVRVRTDGSGLELFAQGTRNIYDLAIDPLLHLFTRDNTNDGDGWDIRLHYLPAGANMGYPALYKNFAGDHMQSLADYGGGSGTGGLWVNDAGFPPGFGDNLYTADWLLNQIFRHPLTAKGGSYSVTQAPFMSVPHPADMAMDGASNMFVASLAGGEYTYGGDSVGFVVRVSPVGRATGSAVRMSTLSDAALHRELIGPNAERRLQAQREMLRRGDARGVSSRLRAVTLDKRVPTYARAAAMFTLQQLTGARSHSVLVGAASDPALRAVALRALADNPAQRAGVNAGLFENSLADTSASVQMAALAGLVRLNARASAPLIVPLTASADASVAHIAVNALVSLQAGPAVLRALTGATEPIRAGALRALAQMHDTAVVSALIEKAGPVSGGALQSDIVVALARLYHRDVVWTGDWWGTRPSFIGPYFAPTAWEGSARIVPVLRRALLDAPASATANLAEAFVRHRVLPQGAKGLLVATAPSSAARLDVVNALVGNSMLGANHQITLTRWSRGNAAGVAELLAAEPRMPDGALPLVRAAAMDTTLGEDVRAKLLGLVSSVPGRAALDAAATLHAQVTPSGSTVQGTGGPIEAAWRRYVGDRRRLQELDYFIEMSRAAQPNQRALGFSVLLQSVRGNRAAPAVSDKVQPVLSAAWASKAAAPDLARAVSIMRLESAYTERLEAHRKLAAQPPVSMEWVPLFNGKDLKDWEIKFAGYPLGENFRNTFRAEDGLLKVRYDQWTAFNGEFGHIFHKKAYSYYIVAAEYRFVGEQVTGAGSGNSWAIRNNGIMVHSQSAASMGLKQDFPISLEVQLLGGLGQGTRTNGNLCTPGTNVVMNDKLVTAHCINSNSITYDGDQWVRVEAMVLGDSVVKHIVNGDTVMTYFNPQMGGGAANNTNPGVLVAGKLLSEGYISLQAETAPIDFRKVEIVNLKGCMDPKAANYKSYYVKSDPSACRKR
ncbi:MAG: family 16 glycoside hydrolase [Gemmatimonas sp.]